MTVSAPASEAFDPLAVALCHAREGRPVFPCRPADKRPLPRHGHTEATTDEETIRRWWKRWPDAMAGMPTGSPSGVFVVDMDRDEAKGLDGVSAFARLDAWPKTRLVATPRGGRHAYFKFDPCRPVTNSKGALPAGVDVRGDGGFVVVAGSRRADGRAYDLIEDLEPVDAPDALYALLQPPRETTTAIRPVTTAPAHSAASSERSNVASYVAAAVARELESVRGAPEGRRNDALNVASMKLGQFVGAGELTEREAVTGLVEAAKEAGLPEREARATVVSGITFGKTKPRDLSAVGTRQAAHGAAAEARAGAQSDSTAEPERLGFADFDGELPPPRPWAFGRVLQLGAVTALAAAPGVGKTSFAMRLAVAFATDRPLGPWSPNRTGPVLYLCGEEDRDEMIRRMLAACQDAEISTVQLRGRLFLQSTAGASVTLARPSSGHGRGFELDPAVVESLKAAVRRSGARLLVIDPLIEFHACDETNEGLKAAGAAIREVAVECGCAVLLAHHTPKGKNGDNAAGDMDALRGGGALAGLARVVLTAFPMTEADADAWSVAPGERHRYVRVDGAKMNMSLIEQEPLWFQRIGVDIGNGTAEAEADQVGTLRPVRLERANIAKALAKTAADRSDRERLARAVVAVCDAECAWQPGGAIPLTRLTNKVEAHGAGMKAGKARELLLTFGDRFGVDGREVKITSSPASGGQINRRVHVAVSSGDTKNAADVYGFSEGGENV